VAQSEGALFAPLAPGLDSRFSLSDTGGLSFLKSQLEASRPSLAYSARASISEDTYGGQVWWRGRQQGFSDEASATQSEARQWGGVGRWTLGSFELSARYDERRGADPRDPLGATTVGARDALLRGLVHLGDFTVSAEASFASLAMPDQVGAQEKDGGRGGLGLRLDYAITKELSVNASHHQRLFTEGEGTGARDDTFSAIGATWRPKDDLGLSLRGGWGPGVGTQVQVGAERAGEGDVAYGVWTADVDGPNTGQMMAVSGARRHVDEHADAFVEDVFARDIDALRMGRAIGLQISPARDVTFSARYERGVRLPFDGEPALLRDAGSGKASWIISSVRISGLAELRHERGDAIAEKDIERWQMLGGLTVDAQPFKWLSLGGRLIASKTRDHGGDDGQSIDAYAAAALRLEPWIVIASYTFTNQIPTTVMGGFAERIFVHQLAVRPSVVLFDRLRIGAGLYAGFYEAGGPKYVLAVSLRPAVRIIGGLEVAAEVARRSAGDTLDALRAEVAYWFFENKVGLALGYNLHGYSGNGVEPQSQVHSDRFYLRLEGAY